MRCVARSRGKSASVVVGSGAMSQIMVFMWILSMLPRVPLRGSPSSETYVHIYQLGEDGVSEFDGVASIHHVTHQLARARLYAD